jgi:RND family efflux transporter MFP subunit
MARVVAAKPKRKAMRLQTTQPARIEAFEETPLYAKLAGYVEEVCVDIGDRVTKGQTLVKLAIPELHDELRQKTAIVEQTAAEVGQARAGVAAAQADVATRKSQMAEADAGTMRAEGELERAKAELDRIKKLAEGGSVTEKLVDETRNVFQAATASRVEAAAKIQTAQAAHIQAQALVEKARADVVAAEARHAVAKSDQGRSETMLQYSEIKAPYDGVITARFVDTQHFVQPGMGPATRPLLVIARTDKMRVFVDVPELEAPLIDQGDRAVLRVQALGKHEFNATVARHSWSLSADNRSLRAEIDLLNPEGILRPGMYATAAIALEDRPEALVLPITAVLNDQDDPICMCVEAGVIRPHKVQLGLRNGSEVEVIAGVTADDTVVMARADSLFEGQRVEILPQE